MTENAGRYGPGRILDQKAENSNFAPLASLFTHDDGLQVTLPTASTPVIATGFREGPTTGKGYVTVDGATGKITIGDKGRGFWTIRLKMSFQSDKANTVIHCHIFLTPSGGSATELERVVVERSVQTANSTGETYDEAEYFLLPGDVLDARPDASINNVVLFWNHGGFGVKRFSGA